MNLLAITEIACVARNVIYKSSTVERRLLLAFTILTIFAPLAQATHTQPARRAIQPEGTARPYELVATAPGPRGLVFARQVLPAQPHATERAQSRVIYLNHNGVLVRPGDNNSAQQVSSIVTEPTLTNGWDVDDDTWSQTVDCVTQLYAPFDVTVTDQDPGAVPHIEAVIGGHPNDIGLDDNVAGISPFTTDCSIIENSIVFTFPDILPDDPRAVCEVMAQEIAHSFGLDHEMLASDPMTYLDYDGDRSFKDKMVSCGEFADRACGINGNTCRDRQSSVQLLTQRLGASGATGATGAGSNASGGNDSSDDSDGSSGPTVHSRGFGGCSATGGGTGIAIALAMLGVCRRRRR